ncbi:MAG: hypothetical protein J7K58_01390 [Euryarchaeota archaeon]|nr:hypothetical protein [Euryarchaeota archaeon]
MKLRIHKGSKLRRARLEFWRPDTGKYTVLIDLRSDPKIFEREFSNGRKLIAAFPIEVEENGQLVRKYWPIPIHEAKEEDGETIIYFPENSQRGTALMEIAEQYGYKPHIIEVEVIRDPENPLNTRYTVKHSDECPCLNKDMDKNVEGQQEIEGESRTTTDALDLLKQEHKRITGE